MDDEQLEIVVNDLYVFYRIIVGSNFAENLPAPHIKSLSKELMKMYRGDYRRLCVAMPPRFSKSSMITLAYPLWLIFHNPNLNILIVNNSHDLSIKFGLELREFVGEFGSYFNVYLSDTKKSQTFFKFCDKDKKLYHGSIRLVGAGGSITGHDADYIIVDDPYKGLAEEFTPSALQKKIDWFNIIIEQRVEPHTRLLVLHTRWNSYDIQGFLKENHEDEYKFISYPAIKDDGTSLWAERYTVEELEKKRARMGNRMFESIYQQRPLDDTSDFIDMSKIHWYGLDKNVIASVRAWDIASADETEELNDYTSGVKMSLLTDNDILISDIVYGKFGNSTKDVIKRTCIRDGMDVKVVIETGVAGASRLLHKEWADQLKPYIVERAEPVTSKVDRATPFKHAILDGKVYFDIADKEKEEIIKKELRSFPNGLHDDIVDSLAHGYNFLCKQDQGVSPDLLFIEF